MKVQRFFLLLCCIALFGLIETTQPTSTARAGTGPKSLPTQPSGVSQGSDKLVYADFETMKDNRPVSNRGGFIQLTGYQEQNTMKSRYVGVKDSNPPSPEVVHLKQGDPNHVITFEYQLLSPNAYAGVGVQIDAAEAKDGKAVAVDASGYKYLSLQLYATGADVGRVEFTSHDNGLTIPAGPPQSPFKISSGFNTYRIPLKSLSQPNWVQERVNPKDVLKKLTSLTIYIYCEQCSPKTGRVVIDNVVFDN